MPMKCRQHQRGDEVSKRLPRPAKPSRARCEVDDSELQEIELAAAKCRLSVASFLRVAAIESAAACNGGEEDRADKLAQIVEKIQAEATARKVKKPGRPKSKK
jgi:hypothetical protein